MCMRLHHGDCLDVLKDIEDGSVDLIVTSPPYAERRKKQYGGISTEKYVDWFLPISNELKRILKPTGTFILNIKEHCEDGERSDYVLRLILALKESGWRWTEEYIWHKKTAAPGKWPNRFRDAWERLLQFNKEKKFNMYQEAVMVECGDWVKAINSRKPTKAELVRHNSSNNSGFGTKDSNWIGRDEVFPSNVLHLAGVTNNVGHPAVFPKAIPEFFVKLFTQENDVVLDPFMGSGTVGIVCKELKRDFIGIDKNINYCELSKQRIEAS